jgi:hypothetical protein
LIASMSNSAVALFFFGAFALTVNPFAIVLNNLQINSISVCIVCQYDASCIN